MLNIELIILSISFLAPVCFIAGVHIGKYHIRSLARNGGEERYPEPVQDVVHKYRDVKQYELDSLDRTDND